MSAPFPATLPLLLTRRTPLNVLAFYCILVDTKPAKSKDLTEPRATRGACSPDIVRIEGGSRNRGWERGARSTRRLRIPLASPRRPSHCQKHTKPNDMRDIIIALYLVAAVASADAASKARFTNKPGICGSQADISRVDNLPSYSSKREFMRAWNTADAISPESVNGASYSGQILKLGPFWRVSSFITNKLFAPAEASRWLGKSFGSDGSSSGFNLFEMVSPRIKPVRAQSSVIHHRSFISKLEASLLDGAPALCLEYQDGWPRLVGMRDELRRSDDGILLGLGSMKISGGVLNTQAFVLQPL